MYNTVKQKLMNGEQVIGGTIDTPDPEIYRAMARAGFDFLWIEMRVTVLSTFRQEHQSKRQCRNQ